MTLTLDVHGMTCARCAETVEKALRCVPGVEIAEVDQPRGRGTVVTAHGVDPDQLTRSVERAGYRAEISGSNSAHEEPAEERASVPPDADDDRWHLITEWVRTSYTLVAPKRLSREVAATDGTEG